jgi:hypothetical protein
MEDAKAAVARRRLKRQLGWKRVSLIERRKVPDSDKPKQEHLQQQINLGTFWICFICADDIY